MSKLGEVICLAQSHSCSVAELGFDLSLSDCSGNTVLPRSVQPVSGREKVEPRLRNQGHAQMRFVCFVQCNKTFVKDLPGCKHWGRRGSGGAVVAGARAALALSAMPVERRVQGGLCQALGQLGAAAGCSGRCRPPPCVLLYVMGALN